MQLKRGEREEKENMTNEIKEMSDKNQTLERQLTSMQSEKDELQNKLKEVD